MYISKCRICGESLVNMHVCSDCSIVEIEDTLRQMKESLVSDGKLTEAQLAFIKGREWRSVAQHAHDKQQARVAKLADDLRRNVESIRYGCITSPLESGGVIAD